MKDYTLKIGNETFEINKAFFEIEKESREKIKNELSKYYDPNLPEIIKCEFIENDKHETYKRIVNMAILMPKLKKVTIKLAWAFCNRKKRITKKRHKNITQLIKFN